MIVQKNISKIPLKLPYICGTIKEQVKNIYDSKIVDTDLLKIGINNGYQQVISGPMAYISTIMVGYVPNKEFYSIFGDGTPSSIYNLKNDYWAQYADTISPALYIDNKIIYEWNGALTSIGKTQYLNIAPVSSNETFEDTKEILVGSVNCISTDNQNISAQSLLTAYEKMPLTDEEQAKANKSNVYNDKYIGNFLSLIETTYFRQLDIENKVLAGANRIYAERYLSYGVFSYEPCVTVSAFSKDIETKGSFSVDILGNYASTVSYRNNADDEYAYRFASGYVSSYLESLVLEEYTEVQAGKTIRFSHDPTDINFKGKSLWNEWEYKKINMGIKIILGRRFLVCNLLTMNS